MEVRSVQVQRKSWGIGVSRFVDQPSINRCPVVLSPHVLFPHPPTTRFTTTSEQGMGMPIGEGASGASWTRLAVGSVRDGLATWPCLCVVDLIS